MADDHPSLLRVAQAVADGDAVDWESESSNEELRGRLGCLRIVESIGNAHRSRDDLELTLTSDESRLPTTWGRLGIVERIGRGGFGEVFRARDPTLERDVALKLLHPRRKDEGFDERRFLDEARRLARVRHANVLLVHGADRHQGRVGLWTDLIRGRTLEECLELQGAFGAEEAARIGADLCRALAAVHAAGLVHNDVKTANVMREEGGRIVLMDFSSVADRSDLAAADAPVSGTPIFMAPELFRGDKPSPASDVYSLGVLLYRLVSRRFPVCVSSISELRERHAAGEGAIPLRSVRSDLPGAFVRVVERAIDPDPSRRFRDMAEMERALATAAGTAPEPGPPASQRRRAWAPIAAGLIVVAGILWLQSRPPVDAPFRFEASLYRTGPESDERLAPGARVSLGEGLFLEVESSEASYVYVLNEDRNGSVALLFPLPETNLRNPLPAGTVHRLPGEAAGVSQDWEVTSVGGEERFLVIAAREQLTEFEEAVASVPRAGSAGPILLNEHSVGRLRGLGGIRPSRPEGEGPSVLSDLSARFAGESAGDAGIRVWEMHLENPEPGS